jgi:hypothetical protein
MTSMNPEITRQSNLFRDFGEVQVPEMSPHYAYLATRVADDQELLSVDTVAGKGQPTPNLLFASVRFLLDQGASPELLATYPTKFGSDIQAGSFELFRDFVLLHRSEIEQLMKTRRVQSNVVRRFAVLLLGLAAVAERSRGQAFSNIEIGASAGLTLLWHKYKYQYKTEVPFGEPGSKVVITTEMRGKSRNIPSASQLKIAMNFGIELDLVDVDDEKSMNWLRALIFPEHSDNRQLFSDAVNVARKFPPKIIAGDALELLPEMLSELPGGQPTNIYHSHTLNQFSREAREQLDSLLCEASSNRLITRLVFEGTPNGYSDLRLITYENGVQSDPELLANCEAHGRWIDWQADRWGGRRRKLGW